VSKLQVWKAIWQVRYPAAALLLDHRGAIADRWHNHSDLTEWKINHNTVRVHNRSQTVYLSADHRACSVVVEGPEAYEQFAADALAFTFETLEMIKVRKLERIGLRIMQIEPRDSFQKLCGTMRRRLYKLSEEQWNVLGGYPRDVGLHLVLVDGDSRINWSMGPMEQDQLLPQFESEEIQKRLPKVSLFLDCDYSLEEPGYSAKALEKELGRYLHDGVRRIHELTHAFVDQFEGFE
jgi:hypothetical protein